MKTLVLFDFDGTLTRKDTFPQFVFFSVGKIKGLSGFILYSPFILLFLFRIISGDLLKQKLSAYYFKGMNETDLKMKGKAFIDNLLPAGMNSELVSELNAFKKKNYDICIVSASFNIWIEPFCRIYGIERLCTELEFVDGVCTGGFKTPNCNHEEKANRIKEKYNLSEYTKVVAYGNSKADKPMFALAHETHWIK